MTPNNRSLKKLFATMAAMLIFAASWMTMSITDYLRSERNETPLFAMRVRNADSGSAVYYVGLFYVVHVYPDNDPCDPGDETCAVPHANVDMHLWFTIKF